MRQSDERLRAAFQRSTSALPSQRRALLSSIWAGLLAPSSSAGAATPARRLWGARDLSRQESPRRRQRQGKAIIRGGRSASGALDSHERRRLAPDGGHRAPSPPWPAGRQAGARTGVSNGEILPAAATALLGGEASPRSGFVRDRMASRQLSTASKPQDPPLGGRSPDRRRSRTPATKGRKRRCRDEPRHQEQAALGKEEVNQPLADSASPSPPRQRRLPGIDLVNSDGSGRTHLLRIAGHRLRRPELVARRWRSPTTGLR